MIELSLWDSNEGWERKLINNPKYVLKTIPELRELPILMVTDKDNFCSNHSKKNLSFIPDLHKLKKFIISDIPVCLGDEKIDIYLILGANPKVGINLESVPEYIRNDEYLLNDVWSFIIEDLLDLFKTKENLYKLYETGSVKILEKINKFPKEINKRESYYYDWVGISSEYLIKDNPENDYWSSFDVYYRISAFGKEFLIDTKHISGGNRAKVYLYETREELSSKINQGIIIELFNYYLWKISQKN